MLAYIRRLALSIAALIPGNPADVGMVERVPVRRAVAVIEHFRPDGNGGMVLLNREVTYNVITDVGRDFMHTQTYGTAPAANGLNYIALSNDTVTETSASTTLSNEIVANGLQRAQGIVTHNAGTNTTTVVKTFTATGAQAAQKAALFTAAAAGTMNHVLGFTQRSLQTNDTLQVTFTLTVG
jgi:hypothetical protein